MTRSGQSRHVGGLRQQFARLQRLSGFPHVPIALAVLLLGLFQLGGLIGQFVDGGPSVQNLFGFITELWQQSIGGARRVIVGVFLTIMAFGLFRRSRLSWTIVTLTLAANLLVIVLTRDSAAAPAIVIQLPLLMALWFARKSFTQSSLATASVFSLGSVLLLFGYAIVGSLMLGQQFSQPIEDFNTALYFSVVTMSTVGYGDISPTTPDAKLFVMSLILLGLTVFATTLSTVVAPLVHRRLGNLIHGKGKIMKLTDHFVIVGDSPLAVNCRRELEQRGEQVVQIVSKDADANEADDRVIRGNPNDLPVLQAANVAAAKAVLALGGDDAGNAFIVLAIREVSEQVKTVVAVNELGNMERVKRVGADMVISPTILGSEVLAMALTGQDAGESDLLARLLHLD